MTMSRKGVWDEPDIVTAITVAVQVATIGTDGRVVIRPGKCTPHGVVRLVRSMEVNTLRDAWGAAYIVEDRYPYADVQGNDNTLREAAERAAWNESLHRR